MSNKQNQSREVSNPDPNVIDWRHLKATDIRNNLRVYLPKSRPRDEELEFAAKEHAYNQVFKSYISKQCDERGNKLESNVTKSQARGLEKLKKRQDSDQITVTTTDKSIKTSVS